MPYLKNKYGAFGNLKTQANKRIKNHEKNTEKADRRCD